MSQGMNRRWFIEIGVAAAVTAAVLHHHPAQSAETSPLVLEATIPLPNVSGRIDHLAIDLPRKRLLVVELGNDTVDVVDVSARRVIHRISGQSEPQGIACAPASDMIVIANGGDGTVRMYAAADFAPHGVMALGDDADNAHQTRTAAAWLSAMAMAVSP